MKVLKKGFSDFVQSYEHFLKSQEDEEMRQEMERHRKHLEECILDIENAERQAEERGKAEGLTLAVLITLKTRFHDIPELVRQRLFAMTDPELLERLAERAASCGSMDEFADVL